MLIHAGKVRVGWPCWQTAFGHFVLKLHRGCEFGRIGDQSGSAYWLFVGE